MEQRLPLTALQADRMRQLALRDRPEGPPLPVPHSSAALLNLRGVLNRPILQRAVDAVVHRQTALRVRVDGSRSEQFVTADSPRLSTIEPAGDTPDERRGATLRALAECSERELHPRGPLFEVALAPIDEREAALLLSADQLVSDLWSVNQLVAELSATYSAFLEGTDPPGALPSSYAAVVEDDLRWLDSSEGREARRQAAEPAARLKPPDLPAPPAGTTTGEPWPTRRWRLDRESFDRLATACRALRTTPSTAVLTALGAAVSGRLGLAETPVHLLVTGRDRPELHPLVMWRSNPLPVWVPAQDRPLSELLRETQLRSFETLEVQRVPWPVVVEDSGARPELAVSLQYVPIALSSLRTPKPPPGLEIQPRLGAACLTGASIDLMAAETADGMIVRCVFRQDLVSKDFVDRVLADLRLLLEAITGKDDAFTLSG